MKKLKIKLVLTCLLYSLNAIQAQNDFIFIWQATDSEKRLDIPTYPVYFYNYNVNWGDGSVSNNVAGDVHHVYALNGNYTVTISGNFEGLNTEKIASTFYKRQMVSIEQWGNNQWRSMHGAFSDMTNLVINSNDVPDLSMCTDLEEMFEACSNINNGTHNKWNLWNTATITNMDAMFSYSNFSQNIGNWDVSNVTNMSYMFFESSFNQNINSWNVSMVQDMEAMFYGNSEFNQPLNDWNVSEVTNMSLMFQNTRDFNQPLNNWNVGKVTTMEQMFFNSNFNENITNWNVSEVTDMSGMFFMNNDFNQDISNWNVSKVRDMSAMFNNTIFNQNISGWNVMSLEDMSQMFAGTTVFNQDIGNWNTANVTNMREVFMNAQAFNQDISNWNVEKVTTCFRMFNGHQLSTANYDALLIGWNAQNLQDGVLFDAGNSKYSSAAAEAARQNMTANDNWVISDGGKIQLFTWTGAVSTDWNTAGNWDTGAVPTATDDVVIADVGNNPRVNFNQSYEVKNLTTHKALIIKNNASLTVNGNLDQRATIQVESFVTGNGSFILRGNQLNPNPPDVTYLRYVSGNNWHLISSPVQEVDIDAFAAATALAEGQNNNRGIGFHNNNVNPKWSYYQNGANDTGNFIEGKGYSIRTSANAFLILRGELKASNLTNYAITENLTGWNLVGNPYPAFINANTNADVNENFLTENAANLDPLFASIYFWNPNTTSYEPVGNGLGARYIAPGQGFFIKSKNGGGTIDINKSMLTHQTGDLFLKTNTDKISLKVKSDKNIAETTIAFKENMTKGLDVTFDVAVFSGESKEISIYTNLLENYEDVPFAIQFLPEINDDSFVIPIGIESKEVKELSLSFSNSISEQVDVVLEDKKSNTFTTINNSTQYLFNYTQEDKTGRFFLHVSNKSLNIASSDLETIKLFKNSENSIQINGLQEAILNVFSIDGKKVVNEIKINQKNQIIQLPKLVKGVYLFDVKSSNHHFVKKVLF